MSEPTLQLSIVSALDHFDLEIDVVFNRLVTGIFGASGAGKTSILKCLAGLNKDATGLIRFNDKDWLNSEKNIFVGPEHRRIGYVPQNGLLFPNKNVRDNLLIASHRKKREYSAVSLESVCKLLDLNHLLGRSTVSLSGGERQRVALGRAIFSDPDLLLLDEPLAALDLKLKRQVLPFLHRIREELNIPMVMISHHPAEIQALCDDVLVIQQGKKIALGPTQEIFFRQKVLQLTHGEHYENIFPAVVAEHSGTHLDNSILSISDNDLNNHLVTAKTSVPPGQSIMVGIPANDIIIATARPEGISAQNVIPAMIEKIEQVNGKFMVCAAINSQVTLNAEVSSESLSTLGLESGKSVFLVIKSGACILYN